MLMSLSAPGLDNITLSVIPLHALESSSCVANPSQTRLSWHQQISPLFQAPQANAVLEDALVDNTPPTGIPTIIPSDKGQTNVTCWNRNDQKLNCGSTEVPCLLGCHLNPFWAVLLVYFTFLLISEDVRSFIRRNLDTLNLGNYIKASETCRTNGMWLAGSDWAGIMIQHVSLKRSKEKLIEMAMIFQQTSRNYLKMRHVLFVYMQSIHPWDIYKFYVLYRSVFRVLKMWSIYGVCNIYDGVLKDAGLGKRRRSLLAAEFPSLDNIIQDLRYVKLDEAEKYLTDGFVAHAVDLCVVVGKADQKVGLATSVIVAICYFSR